MINQGNARRIDLGSRLALVGIAGGVGLAIGLKFGGQNVAFDFGLKLIVMIAATVFCAELLRAGPDAKLWLVPFEMAVVLAFVYRLQFRATPVVILAIVSWAALLVACALRRRGIAFACVVVCAVAVAVGVLK